MADRNQLQFTIEARELRRDGPRTDVPDPAGRVTVEAGDADEAITRYIEDSHSQLVSLIRPARGLESIATVKKEDRLFLVRIYSD